MERFVQISKECAPLTTKHLLFGKKKQKQILSQHSIEPCCPESNHRARKTRTHSRVKAYLEFISAKEGRTINYSLWQ
jgi:hypothetical protein